MVLSISAISSIALPNEFISLKTFWRTSLFTGVLARTLAERKGLAHSEPLFIAGLLHEIGHLVMYSQMPAQSQEARQIAEAKDLPIHEAELQVFGHHYGEVGAMLMARWNLPQTLQTLTRNQPVPAHAVELKIESTLLHLAHQCAQLDAKEFPKTADISFDEEVCALTGLSQEELENTLDEARSMSADMEKVILA
jgi:HD-like signal output (HDOD) protein